MCVTSPLRCRSYLATTGSSQASSGFCAFVPGRPGRGARAFFFGGCRMLRRTVGVLLCLVLLLAAVGAAAQEQQGAILGIVKDNTGAVMPGVTVEARSAAGAVLTTVSDEGGR